MHNSQDYSTINQLINTKKETKQRDLIHEHRENRQNGAFEKS